MDSKIAQLLAHFPPRITLASRWRQPRFENSVDCVENSVGTLQTFG